MTKETVFSAPRDMNLTTSTNIAPPKLGGDMNDVSIKSEPDDVQSNTSYISSQLQTIMPRIGADITDTSNLVNLINKKKKKKKKIAVTEP